MIINLQKDRQKDNRNNLGKYVCLSLESSMNSICTFMAYLNDTSSRAYNLPEIIFPKTSCNGSLFCHGHLVSVQISVQISVQRKLIFIDCLQQGGAGATRLVNCDRMNNLVTPSMIEPEFRIPN